MLFIYTVLMGTIQNELIYTSTGYFFLFFGYAGMHKNFDQNVDWYIQIDSIYFH